MQKWEYYGLKQPKGEHFLDLIGHLDRLGEDGWELVGWEGDEFIFKRRKQAAHAVVNMEGERPSLTQFPNV